MVITETTCPECRKNPVRKYGKKQSGYCGDCQAVYQRQWRADRKSVIKDLLEENEKLRAENAELRQQLRGHE